MSRVSVVVPIYNAGKKLDKCIKSIVNQTFKDFELILVNDGSTDGSLSICERYANEDSRIIIIDKENQGSIKARRDGVEASSSEFVMFVDADDWIDRKAVESLLNEMLRSSADITVCNIYKVLGNGKIFKQKNKSHYFSYDRTYNFDEIRNELVVAYFYGHPFPSSLCAKLYKRELLLESGSYLERIVFLGEDLFYNLEMFLKVKKVSVIDKPLYFYRIGGLTSKFMPYIFEDMVNGYQIQKEVINQFYRYTAHHKYNGISIMLLNTFKTVLCNLFYSDLNESEIRGLIKKYVTNENMIEATKNNGSNKYFSQDYLKAINNEDIDYLYNLGITKYNKLKTKRILKHIISKLAIV